MLQEKEKERTPQDLKGSEQTSILRPHRFSGENPTIIGFHHPDGTIGPPKLLPHDEIDFEKLNQFKLAPFRDASMLETQFSQVTNSFADKLMELGFDESKYSEQDKETLKSAQNHFIDDLIQCIKSCKTCLKSSDEDIVQTCCALVNGMAFDGRYLPLAVEAFQKAKVKQEYYSKPSQSQSASSTSSRSFSSSGLYSVGHFSSSGGASTTQLSEQTSSASSLSSASSTSEDSSSSIKEDSQEREFSI